MLYTENGTDLASQQSLTNLNNFRQEIAMDLICHVYLLLRR